jgi:hypothetical protein
LILIAPDGSVITENDDGGGGTNSRIPAFSGMLSLPVTGDYVIEVASFTGNSTGNYILSLTGSQPCLYSLSQTSQTFNSNGGAGSVSITTSPNCPWNASSNVTWISITSVPSGTGSSAVTYLVAANPSNIGRIGTLTIASQTFTVSQDGSVSSIVPLFPGSPQSGLLPAPSPGNCVLGATQYRIEITGNPTPCGGFLNIPTIELNGNQDVDLYIRFGQQVTVEGGRVVADYRADSASSFESITVSPNSNPPLRSGTYFIAVGNCGPGTASVAISLRIVHADLFGPVISSASVSGKKLFVFGGCMGNGAELFINGEKQKKTNNDPAGSSSRLVAKKSGKKVAIGQTVTLQVRNPGGVLSPEFRYTRTQ